MKKLLISILVLFTLSSSAQNLPVLEGIEPTFDCPNNKVAPFMQAAETYIQSGLIIGTHADKATATNYTDFNETYLTKYMAGGTQQGRYNGEFGTPPEIGSIWADQNSAGLYDMKSGTINKINEMLKVDNGWNMQATYKVDGSNITVRMKVNSIDMHGLPHLRVFSYIQEKGTHNYKQAIGSPKGKRMPVITDTLWHSFIIKGTTTLTNYDVIVKVQDAQSNKLHNGYPSNPTWGDYEYIIYCANIAKLISASVQ